MAFSGDFQAVVHGFESVPSAGLKHSDKWVPFAQSDDK